MITQKRIAHVTYIYGLKIGLGNNLEKYVVGAVSKWDCSCDARDKELSPVARSIVVVSIPTVNLRGRFASLL
jgi:hypothetical protein